MKVKAIERIANQVSKEYGMPEPIVTKIKDYCGNKGYNIVEIRSELTSWDGGYELSNKIMRLDKDYICENQGGCVYIVYKPY